MIPFFSLTNTGSGCYIITSYFTKLTWLFSPSFVSFLSDYYRLMTLFLNQPQSGRLAEKSNQKNILHSSSIVIYSKTCVKRSLSKRPKIVFQDQLLLHVGQKYCRMLQGEHFEILSTFNKLPIVIKIFVLFIFLSECFTQVLLWTKSWFSRPIIP